MAEHDTTSPGPSPPVLRTRVSFDDRTNPPRGSLSRRQSANERRINDILETARERAEAMGNTLSNPQSPTAAGGSPALLSRERSAAIPEDENDSSADEHTGIVMSSSNRRNYASTMTQTSTEARARRTSSRLSQPSTVADMQLPPAGLRENGETRERSQDIQPWYITFLKNFKSIELENKGSVARDHLALERTFLAWLRTSLAFASIGIAVTQLFRLNTTLTDADGRPIPHAGTLRRLGKPLGATFLAISIIILFLGYRRYFSAQQWVMKGKFPASRGTIMLVSFVAFAVMVASLVVVIVVQPTAMDG